MLQCSARDWIWQFYQAAGKISSFLPILMYSSVCQWPAELGRASPPIDDTDICIYGCILLSRAMSADRRGTECGCAVRGKYTFSHLLADPQIVQPLETLNGAHNYGIPFPAVGDPDPWFSAYLVNVLKGNVSPKTGWACRNWLISNGYFQSLVAPWLMLHCNAEIV